MVTSTVFDVINYHHRTVQVAIYCIPYLFHLRTLSNERLCLDNVYCLKNDEWHYVVSTGQGIIYNTASRPVYFVCVCVCVCVCMCVCV